ncbi:MAG: DUF4149 domain-containing protein [Pseudomonadota bacterium]
MASFAALLAAASLGAMLFFSAVVTPTMFTTLKADAAGLFLRRVFPRYFLVNGALAGIAAALAAAASAATPAILMAVGAVILLASRQFVVPIINEARDAADAGDAAAKKRFDAWHTGSVVANLVEMALLAGAIYLLLA